MSQNTGEGGVLLFTTCLVYYLPIITYPFIFTKHTTKRIMICLLFFFLQLDTSPNMEILQKLTRVNDAHGNLYTQWKLLKGLHCFSICTVFLWSLNTFCCMGHCGLFMMCGIVCFFTGQQVALNIRLQFLLLR